MAIIQAQDRVPSEDVLLDDATMRPGNNDIYTDFDQGKDNFSDTPNNSSSSRPGYQQPSMPEVDRPTTDTDKNPSLNPDDSFDKDDDKIKLKLKPRYKSLQCTNNNCDICFTYKVSNICPYNCIQIMDGELSLREECSTMYTDCYECIENCPNGAFSLRGNLVIPDKDTDDDKDDDDSGITFPPSTDDKFDDDKDDNIPIDPDDGKDDSDIENPSNPGGDSGNDDTGSDDSGDDNTGNDDSGNNSGSNNSGGVILEPGYKFNTEGVVSIKGPVYIKEVNNESIALRVAMSIFTNTDLSKITSVPDYAAKCISYGEDFEASYNNYLKKNPNSRPDKPSKLLESAKEQTSIELSCEKLKFDGTLDYEETKKITVVSSRIFDITTSNKFIKVNPTSGEPDKELNISVTCTVNTTGKERTGDITFTCDDGTTATVKITQSSNVTFKAEEEIPSIGDISASESTKVQLEYVDGDNFVTVTLKEVSAEFINYLKSDKPEANNVYLMIEARHPKGKDGSSKRQTTPVVCTVDEAILINKDNLSEILNNPHHITIRPFTRYRIAWDKKKQTDTEFKYKLSVRATFRNKYTGFQQIKNIYTPSGFISTEYLANNS